MIVEEVLSSSEYPIEATGWDEQLTEVAERLKGE
jgi:hypothetical protein